MQASLTHSWARKRPSERHMGRPASSLLRQQRSTQSLQRAAHVHLFPTPNPKSSPRQLPKQARQTSRLWAATPAASARPILATTWPTCLSSRPRACWTLRTSLGRCRWAIRGLGSPFRRCQVPLNLGVQPKEWHCTAQSHRQNPRANHPQIGLLTGGGIRSNIEKGEVTYGDVLAAMPFGNTFAIKVGLVLGGGGWVVTGLRSMGGGLCDFFSCVCQVAPLCRAEARTVCVPAFGVKDPKINQI